MKLSQLQPGSVFRLPGDYVLYELVRVGANANVRTLAPKIRMFRDREGKEVKIASRPTSVWSAGTIIEEVTDVSGFRQAYEDDFSRDAEGSEEVRTEE